MSCVTCLGLLKGYFGVERSRNLSGIFLEPTNRLLCGSFFVAEIHLNYSVLLGRQEVA